MGVKLRGVLRCGRCGKSRGLRHTCVTRFGKRTRRHKLQSPLAWECGRCRKRRGVRHVCAPRSDFKTRRRQQAAAERKARDKARKDAAKAARAAAGKTRESERHEPGTCGDRECPRFQCKAYWQGMADCPLPHDGG